MLVPKTELRIDCARDEVVSAVKAALACGYDIRKTGVICRSGFIASDGEPCFADAVRIVRLSRGSFPLVALIDGQEVRVAPVGNCWIKASP